MLKELVKAFFLIFAAEMGDKTQIIAMTFATKYKVRDVILGVIIGVVFNHGLAIALGRHLSKLVPMGLLQIVAGFMFVIFGIMALKDDGDEDVEEEKAFGPIITVALAFFIGELGDKTQLTAMTLSAEGTYPLIILIGTTMGMVGTSGMGIYIGSKIGQKVPDILIKIVSSIVFIIFGTIKLRSYLPEIYINPWNISMYFLLIVGMESALINNMVKKRKMGIESRFKQASHILYEQTRILEKTLDSICLGEAKCGTCSGSDCLLGYTRFMLKKAREEEDYFNDVMVDIEELNNKSYDKGDIVLALSMIIVDYKKNG